MTLEQMGIPTVPMVTSAFEELSRSASYKMGMPNLRLRFSPHPVSLQPLALVRTFVAGNEPVRGRPLMQEIVDALTRPLSDDDRKTGGLERTVPRLVGPDTENNLQELFHAGGWTDGNVITLPTEERVAAMLKGTGHRPDEVVGGMSPGIPHEAWEFTVEKVAVNAVMAGARPEYLPVLLAVASTGQSSLWTSTTSFARMLVINGPVRQQLGMNSGIGALGPLNRANATIGRAWTLLSKNLSGAGIAKDTYQASQGNNFTYNNICFAENEEDSPWTSFHVEHGFSRLDSVISIFNGWSWVHGISNRSTRKKTHQHISAAMAGFNPSSNIYSKSGAVVLIDPLGIRECVKDGFTTKEELQEWLWENTLIGYQDFWDDEVVVSFTLPPAQEGVEPFATWLKQPKDSFLHRFYGPKEIKVIAVGGGSNPFFQAGDFKYVTSASIDKWR